MKLLGAIIGGGASRRFGSDKAMARIAGHSLLDHARAILSPQVHDLVLCGRLVEGMRCIPDRPKPGLGPLAGIAAALAHADARGFDAVVTVPVDVFPLPSDLVARLGDRGATVLATQYLVGRWPTALSPVLDAHLASGHRSLRSWICQADARAVDDACLDLANINTREDLLAAGAAFMPSQCTRGGIG